MSEAVDLMPEEPSLYDLLQAAIEHGATPTVAERKMAARALRETCILRTIAAVLTTFRAEGASKLLELDLTDPSAMTTAALVQGRLKGQQVFIESLLDYCEGDNDE